MHITLETPEVWNYAPRIRLTEEAIEEDAAEELAMVEVGVAELDALPEPAATMVQIWLVIDWTSSLIVRY